MESESASETSVTTNRHRAILLKTLISMYSLFSPVVREASDLACLSALVQRYPGWQIFGALLSLCSFVSVRCRTLVSGCALVYLEDYYNKLLF